MLAPESEMIDVVALSPAPQPTTSCAPPETVITASESASTSTNEKAYYCQRCLNHDLQIPRKGHKKNCMYLFCECQNCVLVEKRRVLNNMLSKKMLAQSNGLKSSSATNGKKIRDPKCARCAAHGVENPLRGHKKSQCAFSNCECSSCMLVENRRSLMARQIRLRRIQQKQRMAGESGNSPSGSASPPVTISAVLPLPAPPTAKGSNVSTGTSTVDLRIPLQVPTTVAVPSSASSLSSTIPSPSSLSCPSPLVENRPNQLALTAFGFPSSNNLQSGTTLNTLTGFILPNACSSMGGIPAPVPLMPIPIQFQPMSIPALVPISPNCNAPILINPFLLLNFN